MFGCLFVCMFVCMHVRMYVCLFVCFLMYICMYVCVSLCVSNVHICLENKYKDAAFPTWPILTYVPCEYCLSTIPMQSCIHGGGAAGSGGLHGGGAAGSGGLHGGAAAGSGGRSGGGAAVSGGGSEPWGRRGIAFSKGFSVGLGFVGGGIGCACTFTAGFNFGCCFMTKDFLGGAASRFGSWTRPKVQSCGAP